jgi:serine/threonine protein kinase
VYLCQLKDNLKKGITEKYAMKKVSKEILIRKRVSENAKLEK